jgi:hypothetical protein
MFGREALEKRNPSAPKRYSNPGSLITLLVA